MPPSSLQPTSLSTLVRLPAIAEPPSSEPAGTFSADTGVSCWLCDTRNTPSRLFCVGCGSYIAVGPKPSAAFGVASSPLDPIRPLPLGPYAVAARRHERASRQRRLVGALSVVVVAFLGVSAIYATGLRAPGEGGAKQAAGPQASRSAEVDTAPVAADLGSGLDQAIRDVSNGSQSSIASHPAEPAEVQEAPIEVQAALTEIQGAPIEIQEAPAEVQAAPAEIQEAPIEVRVAPAEVQAEPTEVQAAPVTDWQERSGRSLTGVVPPAEPVAEEVVEPGAADDSPPVEPAGRGQPEPEDAVVRRDGWVCDGRLQLEDTRGRAWSVSHVSFQGGLGYERVILHLDLVGPGSSEAASVTAEAVPTSQLRRLVPGVPPSTGRTTIVLQTSRDVGNGLGLRGYRPSGLLSIRKLSVFPGPRGSARVYISAAADGCFKMRVPVWNDASRTGKAQIVLDVKA